ncbi:MAG: Rab family GTPase [Candidatus Thorarchaeota archaeon]
MGSKAPFYKICIVGDFGVGKTTLLHRYLERRFKSDVQSTIASNFFVKHLKIPNVKSLVTLQIWDLAGQERYKWLRQAFYKGAKGIIFVFDLIREPTFDHLKNWKVEVEDTIGVVPNILIGNKVDLLNPRERVITPEETETLKNLLQACDYKEASARLGNGVDNIFLKLTIEMHKHFDSY